jgi:hypothetical protein
MKDRFTDAGYVLFLLVVTLAFILGLQAVAPGATYSFDAATSTTTATGTDVTGAGWEAADEATARELLDSTLADGLAGHWWLDDTGSTTTVVDSSGNGRDGVATANADTLTTTAAKVVRAFVLNGSSEKVTIPETGLPDSGDDWSVTIWARPDVLSTDYLFSKFNFVSDTGHAIQLQPTGNLNFYADADNTLIAGIFAADTWVHIVVTHDAATTTVAIYKNGSLASTLNNVSLTDNAYSYIVGNRTSGGASTFFPGTADEVRIYDRVISTYEITAIFNETNGTQGRIVTLDTNVNATPYQPVLPLTISTDTTTASVYVSGVDGDGDATTESLDIATTGTTARKYARVDWLDFVGPTSGSALYVTQPRMGVVDSDGNGNFDIRADWDLVVGNGADATSLTLTDEHWTVGAGATLTLNAPASVHGTRSDIHYLTGNSYQAVWPGASDVRNATTFGFSWAPIYEFLGTICRRWGMFVGERVMTTTTAQERSISPTC